MPFQYQVPSNPYAQTIADLILKSGEIQARRAENIGAITGQGLQQQGNIWGGAIQNIGQQVGQTVAAIPQVIQQQKDQALRQRMGTVQAATAEDDLRRRQAGDAFNQQVNNLIAQVKTTMPSGQVTIDRDKLGTLMAQSNIPVAMQAQTFKTLDEVDNSIRAFQAAKTDHLADLAHAALQSPTAQTPAGFMMLAGLAKANGLVTDDQFLPIAAHLADGADPKQVLSGVRALSEKYKDLSKPTFAPRESPGYFSNGEFTPIAPPSKPESGVVYKSPDGVEHPVTFNGKDYLYNGQVVTDAVTRPTPQAAPETADQKALREAQLREINARLNGSIPMTEAERERLKLERDKLNQKESPLDIGADVRTTANGLKYVDLSAYQGEQRNKARDAANAAGVVAVSKEQADALQEINNARRNQSDILAQIQAIVPKDSAGRMVALGTTPLKKIFQTDERIAAFNSWRTAAINTLRATAGAKGLRINQAEIAQAVENDIPKLTDTLATAQQKVSNIQKLLNNAESSILVKDASVGAANPSQQTNGLPSYQDYLKSKGGR